MKVLNDIDVVFTEVPIRLWEDGYINRKAYFEC